VDGARADDHQQAVVLPWMMLWMLLRVLLISVSTAVPRIGKKRMRCSGGGSTVMSLMRSSSVWLVFSTVAYQLSLAEVALAFIAVFPFLDIGNSGSFKHSANNRDAQKKTAGGPAVFGDSVRFIGSRHDLSTAGSAGEPKVTVNKTWRNS
jgi:hypothetical protein